MHEVWRICREISDTFLAWFSTTVKQITAAYCELETADDTYSLVARDGSLASVIQIEGTTQLIGNDTFKQLHQQLTHHLESVMAQPGHSLQIVFHHDPMEAYHHIKKTLEPSFLSMDAMHLSLEDVLNERAVHLSQYCRYESTYLVLWTKPTHLNATEQKQAEKDKLALIRRRNLPPFKLTQNLIAAIPALRNSHDTLVQSVIKQLSNAHIQANLLEVHKAIEVIRRLADPEFTSPTWRASLPGDPIPLKGSPKHQDNFCDLLWPALSRQLLPRDAENIDLRSVRLGDRLYSCLFVDLLPKEIQPFSTLLKQTLASDIPWRISFLSDSDSLHRLKFKSLLASILSFSSEENRLLSNANDLLHYMQTNSDDVIVELKIVVCTWANIGESQLLRKRSSALARALQNWGISEVSEISGDPFEGLVATLPGITKKSIATPTLLPCTSMVHLLPLMRPASPWSSGAQLFRTLDGKLWPFQPGSSLQVTWIDLIYARPGSGKSVLSNTLNLALCLAPGLKALPYLSILDIGPSSKGFISLLQSALPPEKQKQVAHFALTMDTRHSINPFDTQLGARYPTYQERTFLVHFLTLLATPIEEETAYDGIADMAGLVIDELYKQYSDQGQPHTYNASVEPSVDEALHALSYQPDPQTTWWEITDLLFNAQYLEAAQRAQRHAMPLLADVTNMIRSASVSDLYGKMLTRTGESLIDAFSRMISRSIREYPILSGITRFDIGSARVVALDLAAVTKAGGAAATRQTAVMYMLARYLLTKNIYLNESLLSSVPTDYYAYHSTRLEAIKGSTKRIVFDEFHRTGQTQAVRDQIINDMREGRKWNIQIALLSQSLEDFDSVMLEFATSTYILDSGPIHTVEKSVKTFGLSPTAKHLLQTQVNGPQRTGTNFLAQFSTQVGQYTQLLTLTLGPLELWALNTSTEDVMLREKLYSAIGPALSRQLLAKLFPEGTVRPILETRLSSHTSTTDLKKTQSKAEIIEQLYQKVLKTLDKKQKN